MNTKSIKNHSGQAMSEYMILVMLIAICSIAATKTVGNTIKTKLDDINRKLESVHVQ